MKHTVKTTSNPWHFPTLFLALVLPLALLIGVLTYLKSAPEAQAAGAIEVTISAGYNLVVDSNVSSPSTYAPSVATVIGTFCNTGDEPVTDVYGYIGDATAVTPGLYPARDSTQPAFQSEHPHLSNSGTYAFSHLGGRTGLADATRYVGTLNAGDCRSQYWHFTYLQCENGAGGTADTPPCDSGHDPVWGLTRDPNDDLWLSFDIWSDGQDASGTVSGQASWTMTMRNEISAMANKIEPNPNGTWFNTNTSVVQPGDVITSNGVLYTLGNVNKGFDNDNDFAYDYNAWLQPIGDAAYDPSCFRLVRTSGVLTVTRGGGNSPEIINFEDQLYFTDLATDNTAVDGLVHYTFMALDGPCNTALSPYQEAASGADNEKFNADYGAGIPPVVSTESQVIVQKTGSPDQITVSGGPVTYQIPFVNNGTADAGLPLSSGSSIVMPLVISDTVPAGMEYVGSSAAVTGVGAEIRFSTDNGQTWSTTDPGTTLSSSPGSLVMIQWWLTESLAAGGGSGTASFQAQLPGAYSGGAIIENEACAQFGSGGSFVCNSEITLVQGSSTIEGTVWQDEDNTATQNNGESVIPTVTVTLYYDKNGDGQLDSSDIVIDSQETSGSAINYSFTGLANGNYLVAVDGEDSDIPTGYSHTTAAVAAVTGLGTTLPSPQTVDFGFGPSLALTKSLVSADPAREGQLVTYQIDVNSLRAGDGSGTASSCTYTAWSTYINSDAETPPSGTGNSGWVNDVNAVNAPDGVYASTNLGNNANTAVYSGFDLYDDGGTITSVDLLLHTAESVELQSGDELLVTFWVNDVEDTTNTYNLTGGTYYTQTAPATYLYRQNVNVNLPGLSWNLFQNNAIEIELQADKGPGPSPGEIEMDAIGLIVTTDAACGGSGDTIDPVPLSDTYDADRLTFVSASPSVSSQSTAVSPYSNTGILNWDNVGPLYGGGSNTVTVTFRALEPASSPENITNQAAVSGAKFLNGDAASDASDSVTHQLITSGSIGDRVWNDVNSNSTDDSEPGLVGVTVRLQATTDVTISGVTYPAGNDIMTAVTDASGAYRFDGLPDATYTVIVDNTSLPGMSQTFDADGTGTAHQSTTTISGAADNLDQDFGYTVPIIIYGTVWQDYDGDGTEDSGDTPLTGVDVTLYRWDGAAWQAIGTLATDAAGAYQFDASTYPAMLAGEYYVATSPATLPAGPTWTNTYDSDGDTDDESGTAVGSDTLNVTAGAMSGAHSFGYTASGDNTVNGNVYGDWNSSSTFDPTPDVGFDSVTVNLYSSTGELVATTTTGSDGSYSFPNLAAGSYNVLVDASTLPAQYTPTEVDGPVTISGTGSTIDNVNFGYEPAGSGTIGDTVWADSNTNGLQDSGEAGLADISVTLYVDTDGNGSGDVAVATTTTDGSGLYSFSDLPPGDYVVAVDDADADLPTDGYSSTHVPTTATATTVSLTAGQNYLNADFGFGAGAVVGDYIWQDNDGDGVQDDGEPALAGVEVELRDGSCAHGSNCPTATTDANGLYAFTGVISGTYEIAVIAGVPAGYTQTGDPDATGSCTTDPNNGCDDATTVSLKPGQIDRSRDFGYQPAVVIGDFIWLDQNNDGVQDAMEPGLGGVTVTLTLAAGGSLTAVTDSDGFYTFGNVPDGSHTLSADVSAVPNSAGLSATYDQDSGTTSPDGTTTAVVASATDLSFDFGYRFAGTHSISGSVFFDSANDGGDRQGGELGYEGMPVYLWLDTNGDNIGDMLIANSTSDNNGDYTFGNLPAGNYTVATTSQSPILFDAAFTTAGNQSTGTAYEHVLNLSGDEVNVDFGFFGPTDPTAITLLGLNGRILTNIALVFTVALSLLIGLTILGGIRYRRRFK